MSKPDKFTKLLNRVIKMWNKGSKHTVFNIMHYREGITMFFGRVTLEDHDCLSAMLGSLFDLKEGISRHTKQQLKIEFQSCRMIIHVPVETDLDELMQAIDSTGIANCEFANMHIENYDDDGNKTVSNMLYVTVQDIERFDEVLPELMKQYHGVQKKLYEKRLEEMKSLNLGSV